MSEAQAKYLDTFPAWLRDLGSDAEALSKLLGEEGLGQGARESIAGGINYLFKSLDLIPDGIDDIGYLDDAFILRVAADLALRDAGDVEESKLAALTRLANEVELVRDFLEEDYPRLEAYVKTLRRGASRGRSVADIVTDATVQRELVEDVQGFVSSYAAPSFAREERNLIKLRAFFNAKLPT
ncbi:MAG: DUF1232 domain-containing protein [Sandaracinaceae bacterium]|nr:DUF1232 domain-containing protein [Sandaracinaceae bacterium]